MSTVQSDPVTPETQPPPGVEVFWRPGCPFCTLLRGTLRQHRVEATWRNIWQDDQALEIVGASNHGNETVPTVRVGGTTLTNPRWRDLAPLLGMDPRTRSPRRTNRGAGKEPR